jgi:CRISPR/Cas system CSM-associated protein Csm2 small subunit
MFHLKLKDMTITIKLPDNSKEANFIVELLKKLNISMVDTADDDLIPEAHKRILDERIDKLRSTPDAEFYSWEDVKKLTSQRKVAL